MCIISCTASPWVGRAVGGLSKATARINCANKWASLLFLLQPTSNMLCFPVGVAFFCCCILILVYYAIWYVYFMIMLQPCHDCMRVPCVQFRRTFSTHPPPLAITPFDTKSVALASSTHPHMFSVLYTAWYPRVRIMFAPHPQIIQMHTNVLDAFYFITCHTITAHDVPAHIYIYTIRSEHYTRPVYTINSRVCFPLYFHYILCCCSWQGTRFPRIYMSNHRRRAALINTL